MAADTLGVGLQRGDIVLNHLHDFVKDGEAQLIRAREDLQIQKARAEANEAKLRRMMDLLDLRKRSYSRPNFSVVTILIMTTHRHLHGLHQVQPSQARCRPPRFLKSGR
jgi:hypothetical protein